MNNKRRRILLITAHPDDECMFFAPSIGEFISEGCCVDLLCLSSGNYDGLGPVRTAEVRKSAAILGIETVLVINDPALQDGPDSVWGTESILRQMNEMKNKYEIICTFDERGVSGHPNHCSIGRAMDSFILQEQQKKHNANATTVYQLQTLPLWLKYLGPLGGFFTLQIYRNSQHLCFGISLWDSYVFGYRAMLEHRSQLVWFRRLYLIFSVYMTVNILKKKTK